jgi:hypothetical protein
MSGFPVTINADLSVHVSGMEHGKMKLIAMQRHYAKHYAVVHVAGRRYASGARGWGQSYAPAHISIFELKGYTVYHGAKPRIEGTADYPFLLNYQPRGLSKDEAAKLFAVKK